MKDWPFWGWVAYGCLAIAAYGMAFWTFVERHSPMVDWFPDYIRSYMWGYVPATLVSIGTMILIIQLIKDRRTTKLEKSMAVTPSISVSASPPVLAKPKKFYSERNKSDLANALTDLSEILAKYVPDIIKKAQYIIDIWHLGRGRISLHDIANLITELNEIANLSNSFYQSLYDDNGLYKKYVAYNDELNHILQIKNQIPIFQRNINNFQSFLSTIKLAEKYKDQNLIGSMIENSKPIFDNYLNNVRLCREWVGEIQRRIDIFRNSHFQANPAISPKLQT